MTDEHSQQINSALSAKEFLFLSSIEVTVLQRIPLFAEFSLSRLNHKAASPSFFNLLLCAFESHGSLEE